MASKNSTRKVLNKMSKRKLDAECLECVLNKNLVENKINF
jgi:hypothetical protein